MSASFGTRLTVAVDARGPLCAGIDPHHWLLRDWGLDDGPRGLERFAMTCVEAMAGEVAVIKPQSAFFERYGSPGIAVLERVVAETQAAGTLVLLDVKRGDVGSTMEAYADAYLGDGSPLAADAVTISPYLGFSALEPAVAAAEATGRGVFVLARTSNPGGATVQRADAGGRSVAQSVVDDASERNAGISPIGPVGVVIGATLGAADLDISALNGPILAPGFGAQGATVADVRAGFGSSLRHVLPASSREILKNGPTISGIRDAIRRVADELGAGT